MRGRRQSDADEPTGVPAPPAAGPVAVRAAEPVAVTREQGLAAMTIAYRQLTETVADRSETDLMLPTRCTGWAVIDVLYHTLLDAQRALIALATPEERLADTDYITYWRPFRGVSPDAAAHARAVRVAAAAFRSRTVVQLWEETSEAAIRAARACAADSVLATQHHLLTLPDLLATLSVEACVHRLDLSVELLDKPAADPVPLALVRRTLDGLLGAGVPRPDWDDQEYALKGTGRESLTPSEVAVLAPVVDRFPLFG
jgi:mycothiol maleylpyruvate isomerase-like protein